MTMRFDHHTLGQRVVFESGRAAENTRAELDRMGARSVMLIGTERQRRLLDRLADRARIVWTDVIQHVPVELADRASAAADENGIDVIVMIGGGSAIGLGKAIALRRAVRLVAVPTTYAGSEATNVWGLTDANGKRTGVADRVLPGTVVYDTELSASMPASLAAASGLNAVAHCIDSLWAPRADPINAALAGAGLRALSVGLRTLTRDAADASGREDIQYGCYLAGVAFASAGSAMHHKICHVLGGMFDLPHAATHAVVLPYVLAWNAPAAPAATARIAEAMEADNASEALDTLRTRLDAPRALRDVGLREQDLSTAVPPILAAIPSSNPRPIDEHALTRLLRAAWAGDDVAGLSGKDSS
jgi:alcohol dehydrogenase class IV